MVRRDGVSKLPRIGTRVRVPFGFDKAEGEVVDAYEGASGPRVEVAVELGGADDAILRMTYRLDEVETANAA
jgi:hypothetical protein